LRAVHPDGETGRRHSCRAVVVGKSGQEGMRLALQGRKDPKEKSVMDTLKKLEAQSIHILREAYKEFKSLVMLWSDRKGQHGSLGSPVRPFSGMCRSRFSISTRILRSRK